MKFIILPLTLLIFLLSACKNDSSNSDNDVSTEAEKVDSEPEQRVSSERITCSNDFLNAAFDFDATGWVQQDKSKFLTALSLSVGRTLPLLEKDILALYGKSEKVMEHPYFMISVLKLDGTPSFEELTAGVGSQYITSGNMKELTGKLNKDRLAKLQLSKPIIDKDKERIIVRTSNMQDGNTIYSISTSLLVPGGVLDMTGSYLKDEADELLEAYSDVLESLEVSGK